MKLIYFIILISTSTVFSQNEWEHVFSSGTDIDFLTNLVCLDSLNCYYMCYDGSINYLYTSKDGGKTWNFKWKSPTYEENPTEYYSSASDFCVTDSMNMFFCTYDSGYILKSTDGGNSFKLIKLGVPELIRNMSMYNEKIGIAIMGRYYFITKDGWETFDGFDKIPLSYYSSPRFINDSILQFIFNRDGNHLTELNINSLEYTQKFIYNDPSLSDYTFLTENTIIAVGYNYTGEGDEAKDRILKSTDKGETWRIILDTLVTPRFPLQSVAFKDSLVGIVVGQFGKILYTYDGGESWIYEENRPEYFRRSPPVLKVKYAGDTPLIAMHFFGIYRLKKDNLLSIDKIDISDVQIRGKKLYMSIDIANDYQLIICDPACKVYISSKLEKENDLSRLNEGRYFISIYQKGRVIKTIGIILND